MTRPLFSVVIPTLGRVSLPDTLASIRAQSDAEIIVVADTHQMHPELPPTIEAYCDEFGATYLEFDAGKHDTGSPQLHMGFQHARGYFLLNCGDDDVYEPGAFLVMRDATAALLEWKPLMFKVELHPNGARGNRGPVVLWEHQRIERFNVTGQSFVCPNDRRLLGRWVDDLTFMWETVALHGGRVEWRDELIARCY